MRSRSHLLVRGVHSIFRIAPGPGALFSDSFGEVRGCHCCATGRLAVRGAGHPSLQQQSALLFLKQYFAPCHPSHSCTSTRRPLRTEADLLHMQSSALALSGRTSREAMPRTAIDEERMEVVRVDVHAAVPVAASVLRHVGSWICLELRQRAHLAARAHLTLPLRKQAIATSPQSCAR